MTRFDLRLWTLVALLFAGVGCMKPAADPYTHHYGEAYWANRNASIANPNAGGSDPVMGLDGETTEGVMENYRASQKDQLPVYDEESLTGGSEGD